MNELHAIIIYFSLIVFIAIVTYNKNSDAHDFFVGRRSMNYWLTALSAHASDMSSWLFMAFPAAIFTFGLFKAWIAIGLLLCMYLNWQFIATKIRIATEHSKSLTFFSYLEDKFQDRYLKLYSTIVCFFFYSIYIAAGLFSMGLLIEKIYGVSFELAVSSGMAIVLFCVIIGGYRTLAWIDLFQGIFLLSVIIFVPLFVLAKLGGWQILAQIAREKSIGITLLPDMRGSTFFKIIVMVLGWGLGYFGQPAIVTKFMGIKNVQDIHLSKYIGMIWMFLALAGATLVGLVAIGFFNAQIANPEMIFVEMVKASFHPFFAGLILCAVFAATMNVISSQMLVIGSNFFEDVCKTFTLKHVSEKNKIIITKIAICISSTLAFGIALLKMSSIYNLVLYAWSGLGSAFGPILIFSLYSRNRSKKVAWAAVISGSISSAAWPWLDAKLATEIDPMVIGFAASFVAIGVTYYLEKVSAMRIMKSKSA